MGDCRSSVRPSTNEPYPSSQVVSSDTPKFNAELSDAVGEWQTGVAELRSALCRVWEADDIYSTPAASSTAGTPEAHLTNAEVENVAAEVAASYALTLRETFSSETRELRERIMAQLADHMATVQS